MVQGTGSQVQCLLKAHTVCDNFVICNDSSYCNALTPSFCANVQVRKAVEVGVGVGVAAMVGVGLVALASSMFGGGSKEKESKR